jgi:hypothetical protein
MTGTTGTTDTNITTRSLTSESINNTTPSFSSSSPTQQQLPTQTAKKPYYNSSSFFAQTFDAAAEHVKSEIAASEPTEGSVSQQRRLRRLGGRQDSVYDDEESMAGVVELRGFVADGWVGGLGG